MKTVTNWKKNHEFESKLKHNSIKLDGDKENGFGPKALLLSGAPELMWLIYWVK